MFNILGTSWGREIAANWAKNADFGRFFQFFAIFVHLNAFNVLIFMQKQFKRISPCSDIFEIMISLVLDGISRVWIPRFNHLSQFCLKISQNLHFSPNLRLFPFPISVNITLVEYLYQFNPLLTLLNGFLHTQGFLGDIYH